MKKIMKLIKDKKPQIMEKINEYMESDTVLWLDMSYIIDKENSIPYNTGEVAKKKALKEIKKIIRELK